jgi:adenylate kinase
MQHGVSERAHVIWRKDVNILLIGAQGSGKGTQAEKLSAALHLRHISSGDLFRQATSERTREGLQAQAYLDRGELVPDSITIAMVLARIARPDCSSGILLDGFPRTIAQARALDTNMRRIRRHMDAAVYLDVKREELITRLSGRYICHAHQHIYNIATRPPKVAGICDIDGSALYQRSDDKGEAVAKRLDTFFNETIKLLDYYDSQQKLIVVNGNQNIEEVHADMLYTLTIARNNTEELKIPAWQIPVTAERLPLTFSVNE